MSEDNNPFALVKRDPNQPEGGLIGVGFRAVADQFQKAGVSEAWYKASYTAATSPIVPDEIKKLDEGVCKLGFDRVDQVGCQAVYDARAGKKPPQNGLKP